MLSSARPAVQALTPAFYTYLMHVLSTKWNILFKTRPPATKHTGDRMIIDNILLFAIRLHSLSNYLEYHVLVIYQNKYRLPLKLNKCDFLKDRVEYVGHGLNSNGNCPSKSRFEMITNWPLPATSQALHSLIQLCNVYHKYCPWLEFTLKPLQHLIKLCHYKPIPADVWTPELRLLFDEVRVGITSSPCPTCYDCAKPIFLKMDCEPQWLLLHPSCNLMILAWLPSSVSVIISL
jgi:hypothetical protein